MDEDCWLKKCRGIMVDGQIWTWNQVVRGDFREKTSALKLLEIGYDVDKVDNYDLKGIKYYIFLCC